jgi:hypothetical protein
MEYVSLFDRGYPLKALACRDIIFGEDDDAYEGNIQKTACGRELKDNMVNNFEIETFGDFVLSAPWQVAARIGGCCRHSNSVVYPYVKESFEGINFISGKSLCFDNGREIKVGIDVAKMHRNTELVSQKMAALASNLFRTSNKRQSPSLPRLTSIKIWMLQRF